MNIHEYQAKALLKGFGAPVAEGVPVFKAGEAEAAAKKLPGPLYVVKSQIHAGGRGKGKFKELSADAKGGVRLAKSVAEVIANANEMLGHTLVTKQTGPAGKQVNRLYIEDGADIERELYLSILVDRTVGRIGALIQAEFPQVLVRLGPLDSLWQGARRTADMSLFTLRMMGRMVVGDVSWKNVTGPVTIAEYAGRTARIGLESYLGFLALISISIGVLNLLPIPMLDGGHLLFYLIEALRGGRPLSERARDLGQRLGLGVVLGLMVLALFNDFSRLFS